MPGEWGAVEPWQEPSAPVLEPELYNPCSCFFFTLAILSSAQIIPNNAHVVEKRG